MNCLTLKSLFSSKMQCTGQGSYSRLAFACILFLNREQAKKTRRHNKWPYFSFFKSLFPMNSASDMTQHVHVK